MLEEFRRVSQRATNLPGEDTVSLTARERGVLCLVSEGASNKEIAQELNVSIHTVKSHMRKILAKLHTDKRQEAATYAKREGLIPPSPRT